MLHFLLELFVLLHSGSTVTEYYVRSSTSTDCPAKPCLTLNEYAQNPEKYFTSNTAFIFLDGEHHLDSPLYIITLSNLFMNGTANTTINLSEKAYIMVFSVQGVAMTSLAINYHSYEGEEKDDDLNSALYLYFSLNVNLTNVKFSKFPGPDKTFTRAMLIYLANVNLTNCMLFLQRCYKNCRWCGPSFKCYSIFLRCQLLCLQQGRPRRSILYREFCCGLQWHKHLS